MNAIVNSQATSQNDIIDINISGIGKKKIRINGDDSKILLLNTNDNNVAVRYTDVYPKLKELENDFKELGELFSGRRCNALGNDCNSFNRVVHRNNQ